MPLDRHHQLATHLPTPNRLKVKRTETFDDSHQIGELESSSNENPFHDSYEIQNSTAMVGPRNVAHAEESAEVEVLTQTWRS
jgi:hypothetical protein